MEAINHYLPHLLELRQRALRCVYAFFAVALPLLIFSKELYTLFSQSLLHYLPANAMLIATQVATPFTTPIKLAVFTSFILIVPYVLYHIWGFIAPGLYKQEQKAYLPLIILSTILFYLGMLFAHFVVCPMTLMFFHQIAPDNITVMTDIAPFLDFLMGMYLAFGFCFEVPILTLLCCKMGMTSVTSLKKHRPYIIVGAFVVGMLLTPPDVISQCLLAIPLLGLFEVGLWLSQRLNP